MSNHPTFSIIKKDSSSKARAGILQTPHGTVETPVFMPVGTQGSVKTMGAEELEQMGYQILLSNTYHLILRPGSETLKNAGGLHKFMSWPRALLTDSGGYQVFSLAPRCKISETGVEFSSHVDGTRCELSPEITTRFQLDIGADIAMCLDDCPPYPSLERDARQSMERTLRWAERCRQAYQGWLKERDLQRSSSPLPLLFGITQGASFPELRKKSSQKTVEIGFPGYAIGGLGVGEPRKDTVEFLEASLEPLPVEQPRYLMGFGKPEDMWEFVEKGVDMFDCVLPTRNGRNGQGFTSIGRINVANADYKEDFSPLDTSCNCLTCTRYTRAYICHLFRAGEMLAPRLVTLHNLCFMIRLLRSIRDAILNGKFQEAKKEFLRKYERGESDF
ncbi:MAG: tRNA guanosine(34) transglycosylase Tgt [Elusimicrobia bacterium]|nr:tRNA guanosine(34) transglycosylase Tgt [Candidatus Obscuribacterium magneticum]